MYDDTSNELFFVMLIILFYLQKRKNFLKQKYFTSFTQMFKLVVVWAAKMFKNYIIVTYWVTACLQSDSERPNGKYQT